MTGSAGRELLRSVGPEEPLLGGVDRRSPIPLHFQIRALLIEMIERGDVHTGAPLPSERVLAERYGISLAPIRQAILDLVKEGVLYRVRGQGTFLRERPRAERVSVLTSFSESLRARGANVEVSVLRQEKVTPSLEVAKQLGTRRKKAVLVERVTTVDREPAAVLVSHVPAARFAALAGATLPGGSLYRYLEDVYGAVPMRAETLVEVVPCSTPRSAMLRVPPGTPLLQVSGTVCDESNEVIEVFEVQYRTDLIRLRFDTLQSQEDIVAAPARGP
jgi:GntR family transcriptional regulator